MIVVLPDPVAPTSPRRWPGRTSNDTSRRTQSSSEYANHTWSNTMWPCSGSRGMTGVAGLATDTGVSSSVKMRSDEAMADCNTLNFSDMSLMGR